MRCHIEQCFLDVILVTTLIPLLSLAIFCSTSVSGQTHVLQPEEPVVLKARKLQRFELTMGKHFDLVLEQANTFQPVALVSSNVHDHYGNVTVPRGSRVIGRYVGFQSGYHLVDWTSLQVAGQGVSLKIEPPLLGTMLDGTTGYVDFEPGTTVGALFAGSLSCLRKTEYPVSVQFHGI